MIECDLLPMPESLAAPVSGRLKHGRYHKSSFWTIKDYGTKKWVVAAYIEVKDQGVFDEIEHEEVFDRCMEYINRTPPRKKYAKKPPAPKYGKLELYQAKTLIRDGQKVIAALLITDNKKHKLFWGRGQNV